MMPSQPFFGVGILLESDAEDKAPCPFGLGVSVNGGPELGAVVGILEVDQLMDDHIFQDP